MCTLRETEARAHIQLQREMLRVEHEAGEYALVPGEFRHEAKHDVFVGRHRPPSSARVGEFMHYFEQRYRFSKLGTAARIFAMASAHHRSTTSSCARVSSRAATPHA